VKKLGKPFVRIEIADLEEYIASVVADATSNFITIEQAAYLINEGVKYEVAKAVASLEFPVASGCEHKVTTQEVKGDTVAGADVVYSNLDNELDVAKVSLPRAVDAKKITFLAKLGGMSIEPNSYNLPQRDTIEGSLGITVGVGEVASHIGSPLTASYIMKPVFYKYENVTLLSDGVDTWYVV
jgi:hypothetical protein